MTTAEINNVRVALDLSPATTTDHEIDATFGTIAEALSSDGFYDPWGELTSAAFTLCDFQTFELKCNVPSLLHFRPSPMGSGSEEDYLHEMLMEAGDAVCGDVIYKTLEYIAVFRQWYEDAGISY